MLQINYGQKYIHVPADEYANFIRAMVSIKDDIKVGLKEWDIYHKQNWNDDPEEKEARKNNADRKKINKDTLDIHEAEALPIPDQILRTYNVKVKDAKTMAGALLSMFNQINSKEDKDYTQLTSIKRVIDLLNNITREETPETEEPAELQNEGATCCGKCGRVHIKGNCKRPYLKGKAHCRNNK